MKLRNTLLSMLCVTALTASAIPARRGVVHQHPQPDGSYISLELVGDEHAHYYLTTDKKIVLADGDKYCYANIDGDGRIVLSDMLAHDPQVRTADEISLVDKIDCDLVREKITRHRVQSRANNQDGSGKIEASFPTSGNVKTLVFLVSYADLDFTIENPNEYFTRLLNEEGFSENGAVGSCRDYYIASSGGQFVPEFDVFGPVKLPKKQAYYGGNSAIGIDMNLRQMLQHAGELLDDEIDFSEYDLNGDGYVDNVFIFYAGYSEADGGGADCVWPQSTEVGFNFKFRFDDVQLNHFACGSELNINTQKPDGIGTCCHEFAHVLGLPDLYNTEIPHTGYTPEDYDIMDNGCNISYGNEPPTFSAFERNALGWMGDNLVEITGPASCTLEPLNLSGKAYLINTDNENEYFILENRQQIGWDSKLPGHGMLIWHIDYDKELFTNNMTNNDPDHQRVDLVEASGSAGMSTLAMRKYPFPGTGKVKSFTYDGKPSFRSWSGADLGLPITNIKEAYNEDGVPVITFNVAGGGPDPTGIADVTVGDALHFTVAGRHINATADGEIMISDISGRVIASARGNLNIELPIPGIYIISSASGTRKLMIRDILEK